MAINFVPQQRTVLICDYSTGFVPPEMVKRRPVVVLSPWRPLHTGRLIAVVPFSTRRPQVIEPFHVHIPAGKYAFFPRPGDQWVKCDVIAAVSLSRLSVPHVIAPHPQSTRLARDDFRAVQNAVLNALGI